MDILQPLPFEEWTSLEVYLKEDWPKYSFLFYFVNTMVEWKKKAPHMNIEFYCPHGNHTTKTFVSIFDCGWRTIVPFASTDSNNVLRQALLETKRINWKEEPLIAMVHEFVNPVIHSVLNEILPTYKLTFNDDVTNFYFKSAEECKNVNIEVPEDCYLGDIDESHIPLINSIWPHRSEEHPEISTSFLRTLSEMDKGTGLFLKQDGSLVSWTLVTCSSSLGMLQTVDAYKRRGYARIVVEAAAKKLGERGIDTIVTIVQNNVPSEKLFQSLKWKKMYTCSWFHLVPK